MSSNSYSLSVINNKFTFDFYKMDLNNKDMEHLIRIEHEANRLLNNIKKYHAYDITNHEFIIEAKLSKKVKNILQYNDIDIRIETFRCGCQVFTFINFYRLLENYIRQITYSNNNINHKQLPNELTKLLNN
jgi:hypothetical protein